MFSGIVTHLGKLVRKNSSILWFEADKSLVRNLGKGTSISINGVCLTVLAKPKGNLFSVQVMPETEKRTMLGALKIGGIVNLELPITPNTFLSGHLVQGHVDGVGIIKDIKPKGNSYIIKIGLPINLSKYIIKKGSISVNGIALTVIDISKTYFTVGIIPYTWTNTMLHKAKVGDSVNIEVDMIAKYVESLL